MTRGYSFASPTSDYRKLDSAVVLCHQRNKERKNHTPLYVMEESIDGSGLKSFAFRRSRTPEVFYVGSRESTNNNGVLL